MDPYDFKASLVYTARLRQTGQHSEHSPDDFKCSLVSPRKQNVFRGGRDKILDELNKPTTRSQFAQGTLIFTYTYLKGVTNPWP